jgi:hypothetical protein
MIDRETLLIYDRVAKHLAARVNTIFASEASLQAAYEDFFPGLPLDRTMHWDLVLRRELVRCWEQRGPEVKGGITLFDENYILNCLAYQLDYNLFTQVMLNLQPSSWLRYRSGDAEVTIEQLRSKWEGRSPSPFEAKPKLVKTAATEEEIEYNRDLSTLKALKIVSALAFTRSFRVSPKGTTPALTDSENISMLGAGGDQFLTPPPGLRAFYFTWESTPYIIERAQGENRFHAESIGVFESKSGGDVLNSALFSRYIAFISYRSLGAEVHKVLVPRMNSVLLLTNATDEQMEAVREAMTLQPCPIEIHEGVRREKALANSQS